MHHTVLLTATKPRCRNPNSCASWEYHESCVSIPVNLFKSEQGDPFRMAKLSYLGCLSAKGKCNVQMLYKELLTESMENEFNKKKSREMLSTFLCWSNLIFANDWSVWGVLGLLWENTWSFFQDWLRGIFALSSLEAVICCLCWKERNDSCHVCFLWHDVPKVSCE